MNCPRLWNLWIEALLNGRNESAVVWRVGKINPALSSLPASQKAEKRGVRCPFLSKRVHWKKPQKVSKMTAMERVWLNLSNLSKI
jgi:hypothetical protein